MTGPRRPRPARRGAGRSAREGTPRDASASPRFATPRARTIGLASGICPTAWRRVATASLARPCRYCACPSPDRAIPSHPAVGAVMTARCAAAVFLPFATADLARANGRLMRSVTGVAQSVAASFPAAERGGTAHRWSYIGQLGAVDSWTAQRSPARWNSAGTARAPPAGVVRQGYRCPRRSRSAAHSVRRHVLTRTPACVTRLRRPRLAGPAGGGTVEQVRSCRVGPGGGLVAPDPGDVSPERCARETPRRTERRTEQHPAFLPCRLAAPQLQTGCLLPSIRRRLAFVHWHCRYGRWACSTAGPATTG